MSLAVVALIAAAACGGGGSGAGAGTDGDCETRVSLPVPLRAAGLPASGTGTLLVSLRIDAGAPRELRIDGDTASGSATGLAPGRHEFEVILAYRHTDFGASVVTRSSRTIDIQPGSNHLDFPSTGFDLGLDNDGDGVANLDELLGNSNPQAMPTWGDTLWGRHAWRVAD